MLKRIFTALIITIVSMSIVNAQPPKVPKSIVFAGEKINLNRSDLRERMDRELIAFTYSHSISVLMLKRSGKLFPRVEPILKENGIPDDLKYLMVIESNLDPNAKSPAGAAGLWQFMQVAAKEFGLEVNANVDERYNVEKATQAACRYLKKQYAKYGSWMSVLASYNAGPNAVSSRMEAQHQDNAMELLLVDETARYMFRALAAKMMFENPGAFGFHLDKDDIYPYIPPVEIVTVTDPIENLVTFAENHGVTYALLRKENLWLRESKLNNSSHKEYQIRIPDMSK